MNNMCIKTCQYNKNNECDYNGSDWMQCDFAIKQEQNKNNQKEE